MSWRARAGGVIAQATIRELEYNTVQRRRGKRTLQGVSIALEWHPDHLEAPAVHGPLVPVRPVIATGP